MFDLGYINNMENIKNRVIDRIDRHGHAAQSAFKVSEVWFKYASWLLTLGAVKFIAELTNSRLLYALVFALSLQFWSPIAYLIIGPDLRAIPKSSWLNLMKVLAQLALLLIVGYFINMRLNIIVDAIVKTHIKG